MARNKNKRKNRNNKRTTPAPVVSGLPKPVPNGILETKADSGTSLSQATEMPSTNSQSSDHAPVVQKGNQVSNVEQSKKPAAEPSSNQVDFAKLKEEISDLNVQVQNVDALIEHKIASNFKTLRSDVTEDSRGMLSKAELLLSKAELVLKNTEDEFSDLINVAEDRRDFVRRYNFGTIEELNQRIEVLRTVQRELHEELAQKNSVIDACQRDLEVFKTQSGLKDIDAIRTIVREERLKLDELRDSHGAYETLVLECVELRRENTDLKDTQSKYKQIRVAQENIIDLRNENLRLQNQLIEIEDEKRTYIKDFETQKRSAKQSRNREEDIQKKLDEQSAEFARLKQISEDLEKANKNFEERCEQHEVEIIRIHELEDQIQTELDRHSQDFNQEKGKLKKYRESLGSSLRQTIEFDFSSRIEELDAVGQRALKDKEGLERKYQELSQRYEEEKFEFRNVEKLKREKLRLENELVDLNAIREKICELNGQRSALEGTIAEEREKLDRIRLDIKDKERTSNLEERIRVMVKKPEAIKLGEKLSVSSEAEWLKMVSAGIQESGFGFPPRLLKAFHTSLKIADWSSLTILAGVSGTGKSELPQLYSRFGGLNFLAVPVQPNWDTPADLFGFFDYLSGQFKPTELLRSIVQCDIPKEEGGSKDSMLVVMLDEMNLARVELYFSDLLSRLENRSHQETPKTLIDIGPGEPPYKVVLGHNLLFVGTINEDETTNTLSDKVIDRSNVIYFPRPKRLVTRDKDFLANELKERLALTTWMNWQQSVDTIDTHVRGKIKDAFEDINDGLRLVNRAVAHRVLQITERYVANHPDFKDASQDSKTEKWTLPFEDQIAQKLMPKLRGISTTSDKGKKCIEKIQSVIERDAPGLMEDFKEAQSTGHGQFLWSSSTYLENGS